MGNWYSGFFDNTIFQEGDDGGSSDCTWNGSAWVVRKFAFTPNPFLEPISDSTFKYLRLSKIRLMWTGTTNLDIVVKAGSYTLVDTGASGALVSGSEVVLDWTGIPFDEYITEVQFFRQSFSTWTFTSIEFYDDGNRSGEWYPLVNSDNGFGRDADNNFTTGQLYFGNAAGVLKTFINFPGSEVIKNTDTVESAELWMQASFTKTQTFGIDIDIYSADDTPISLSELNALTLSGTSYNWIQAVPPWSQNQTVTLTLPTGIIQDHAEWNNGKSVCLLFDGSAMSQWITVYDARYGIANRPKLSVEWITTPLGFVQTFDTFRHEYKFKLILSGDSGTTTNWVQLFDNTVWDGKATGATATWNATNSRWEIETGTRFADYPYLTPAGTDFDTFRPTKFRIYFTGADTLTVRLHHSNAESYDYTDISSGEEMFVFWDIYAIVKLEFIRDDIYEIYPYITDIQFYDADFIPTVIDDLILPCPNCNVTYQLKMKDSEGNEMPIWDSADNPGDNGYSMAQSKYVINFTSLTVPGEDYASDIYARLNNEITLYISTLTTNGEPDFQELVSGIIESAIPDTGAMSRSIRLSGKLEIPLSDVTWNYQEVYIDKINYLSPNQTDGKYTWQCPGINTNIKPGFKAIYGSSDILVSEVQYIISPSNIQFYLKE